MVKVLSKHLIATRKELSKVNYSLYAWLWIHERKWFDEVIPKGQRNNV
ncbi:hypothetical protein MHB40_18015 [Lysinibacillus sp. FSL K6-0057]